jgi:hypothetical protein
MCWTASDGIVEPADASDAATALLPFAGIAVTDVPQVRPDKYYDDGGQNSYLAVNVVAASDSDALNYLSATDYSWSPLSGANVLAILTQGVCEVWISSGASGAAVAGALVAPAYGLSASTDKFDGCARVMDFAEAMSGNYRPFGVIVSGTSDADIHAAAYGTVTTNPILKAKVRLY